MKARIFKVEFTPMWPVGCCCIIAASNMYEAEQIARETIKHTDNISLTEVDIKRPCVIAYLSGDY